MWGDTPDTSDRCLKVETRNPASQFPAKSSVFLGFPIQVVGRPRNPHWESDPAVHVRQMSEITSGRQFSAALTRHAIGQLLEKSLVSHTNAHFWRQK